MALPSCGNFLVKAANAAVVVVLLWGYSSWAQKAAAADAAVKEQISAAERASGAGGAYATDGTFTGTAQGYGGPVTVEVTVEGGYITAARIVDASSETPSYLAQAEPIVDRIVEEQTPNVDTVSGATFSSAGIINAAVQALQQSNDAAGGSSAEGGA